MNLLFAIALAASGVVGPTADITGASSIDDAGLSVSKPVLDYGACTPQVGDWTAGNLYRALFRVDEAEIPAGTITQVTLYLWRRGYNPQSGAGTIEAYALKDANAGWLEGVVCNAAPADETAATWAWQIQYATAWSGGQGALDWRADASPPTLTMNDDTGSAGSYVAYNVNLETAWFSNWRDSVWSNGGFVLVNGDEGTANKYGDFQKSEAASNQWYITITYAEAATSSVHVPLMTESVTAHLVLLALLAAAATWRRRRAWVDVGPGR